MIPTLSPMSSLGRRFLAVAAMTVVTVPGLAIAADAFRISDTGSIGLGIDNPVRQLHLQGSDAVFRMDRNVDTASFLLVRTSRTDFNTVWKTFVVGTNASGVDNGEFVISDYGTAVRGGGAIRRMTIKNNGDVDFPGNLTANTLNSTSSIRYKKDIAPIVHATESLEKLRGVHFNWKDDGSPSLGLIAEEVAEVFPEIVQRNPENGQVEALNYTALTAVLVEALKEQQGLLAAQQQTLESYKMLLETNQAKIAQMEGRLNDLGSLQARLAGLELLLTAPQPQMASVQRP